MPRNPTWFSDQRHQLPISIKLLFPEVWLAQALLGLKPMTTLCNATSPKGASTHVRLRAPSWWVLSNHSLRKGERHGENKNEVEKVMTVEAVMRNANPALLVEWAVIDDVVAGLKGTAPAVDVII